MWLISPFTEKRVAAGLKAAIHNPNVSEEARERAQERLEQFGAASETGDNGTYAAGATDANGHEVNRVLGGYKATLKSAFVHAHPLSEAG